MVLGDSGAAAEVLGEESMRSTGERCEAGADTGTDLPDARTTLARGGAAQVSAWWDCFIAAATFRRSVGNLVESRP